MLWSLLDIVFPPRDTEQLVRACSVEAVYALLSPQLIERTTPPTVGLLPFKDPLVRALIHEAKYFHSKRAYELLAHVLALYISEHVLDQDQLGNGSYALVPMPLGSVRYKERGYNQVSEVVSRVGILLDIPIRNCLLKIRDTKSQTKLSREERIKNQEGVFKAVGVEKDTTYVLIDDVVTTGATIQSAREALGENAVVSIGLAH